MRPGALVVGAVPQLGRRARHRDDGPRHRGGRRRATAEPRPGVVGDPRVRRWRLVGSAVPPAVALLGAGLVSSHRRVVRRGLGGTVARPRRLWGLVCTGVIWCYDELALGPGGLSAPFRATDAGAGRRLRRARTRVSAQPSSVLADLRYRAADAADHGLAGQVLGTPLVLIGEVATAALGPRYELLGLVVVQAVTTVLAAAFVAPFSGAAAAWSARWLGRRSAG